MTGMLGFIVMLHAIGFGNLFTFVVPNHYHLGGTHPVFSFAPSVTSRFRCKSAGSPTERHPGPGWLWLRLRTPPAVTPGDKPGLT
jgi:hypothetical protein